MDFRGVKAVEGDCSDGKKSQQADLCTSHDRNYYNNKTRSNSS